MTVSSIGTGGRDYSTIQAWEDAAPATLSAPWEGECYNDSEFAVAGTVVTFAGTATSATNFIELRCATGQSFRDNANVQTNALRYNQANGVGLRTTAGYVPVISVAIDNVRLAGLQAQKGGSPAGVFDQGTFSLSNVVIDACLFEQTIAAQGMRLRAGKMRNSVLIQRVNTSGPGVNFDYAGTLVFVNNTIVRPSDKTRGGSALDASSGVTPVKNCAFFGFSNVANVNTRFTFTTGASDVASPPTGVTGSLTYASQFENTVDATRDFRLKSGSSLIDAGTTDSTNAATDIAGTARPSGSAYDIGAWEFVAAGATSITGSAAISFASMTLAAQGALGPITGQASATFADMTLAAAGALKIAGAAAVTFDDMTLAAAGALGPITGQAAITFDNMILQARGAGPEPGFQGSDFIIRQRRRRWVR